MNVLESGHKEIVKEFEMRKMVLMHCHSGG